jgi:serine/threonine protein kinase/WD40 repeat protein
MLKLLTCTRGHFWEVAVADGAEPAAACPECGAAPESLPLLDLAPSEEVASPRPAPLALALQPLFDAAGLPILAGYEPQEKLGRGPTGVLFFRARQPIVNRLVLLKVVAAKDDTGQRGWGSLRGEATALGRLQHPNIVQVLDAGERDRQLFYNAVELVAGPSLAQMTGPPLPFTQVVRFLEVLALAIDHAHTRGVVHRNLKPSSVLLQQLDRPDAEPRPFSLPGASPVGCQLHKRTYVPKITDFGLCRRPVEGEINDLELYGNEPGFLSPEQAWGRAREIGPATDVYGLGALLYYLLTGRPPFQGRDVQDTVETVQTQRLVPPAAVRGRVPGGLDAICRKCLSAQPNRRYASAREVADDLRRCAANLPIKGREVSAAQRFGLWLRRRPAVAAILVLLFLGSIGAYTGFLVGLGELAQSTHDFSAMRSELAAERAQANQMRARLDSLEKQQRFADYLKHITDARELINRNLIDSAREALEDCPVEVRHWEWHYLHRSLHDTRPVALGAAPEPVSALAFNPQGPRVLAVAWYPREGRQLKGAVRLWEVGERPRVVLNLTDFQGPVRAIAFRADGRSLATASSEGADGGPHLRVWDVDPNSPSAGQRRLSNADDRLVDRPTQIADLAYSRDGAFLYTARTDGTLTKLDANTLEMWRQPFFDVDRAINPSLTRLAVGSDGKKVVSLDPFTKKATVLNASNGTREIRIDDVRAVAFADSKNLATARDDNFVQIWDTRAGGQVRHKFAVQKPVDELAFSADGQRLAVACSDGMVRVWGWTGAAWREVYVLSASGSGGLAFSPDNRLLATVVGKEVNLWGAVGEE